MTDAPHDPRPGLGGRCRSVLSHVCFASRHTRQDRIQRGRVVAQCVSTKKIKHIHMKEGHTLFKEMYAYSVQLACKRGHCCRSSGVDDEAYQRQAASPPVLNSCRQLELSLLLLTAAADTYQQSPCTMLHPIKQVNSHTRTS